MFDSLTERLAKAMRKLVGRGRLTPQNMADVLQEVRNALLDADVHLKTVRTFVERVEVRATGQEVLRSLTPDQHVIKIVFEELTRLMGEKALGLHLKGSPPHVVLLVGLQGSGKTTASVKLAKWVAEKGRHPLLVAADPYRPAAQDQLAMLAAAVQVPVILNPGNQLAPPALCARAREEAKLKGCDTLIVDTAGRLHVDDDLMKELAQLKAAVSPTEILLVVDAMTGQDAVNVAAAFHARLEVTGILMTKMDGDARGGAALSVREVTGCPIKFVGVGEKPGDLEVFHPDRMARRILGMGDVLTLIEKAERTFEREHALEMQEKLATASFTLDDFLQQLRQMKKMGPLEDLLALIPGMPKLGDKKGEAELEMKRIESIICSMTRKERMNPKLIDASRRRRIARGSGVDQVDVGRLLKQFEQATKMMKQLARLQKGFNLDTMRKMLMGGAMR